MNPFVNGTFSTNNSIKNTTAVDEFPPITWTTWAICSMITCASGFLTNAGLLLLFARRRTLRTPFNIYLMNLLFANLIYVVIAYPMEISSSLHATKWRLGVSACTVYLYSFSVLQAAIFHSHLLITVNRLWAVIRPFHYHSVHTARTAVCLCLGVWVYVHLAVAPEWALDALYYRPVQFDSCYNNAFAQVTYDLIAQNLFYNLPHLLMILALPVIYIVLQRQRRVNPAFCFRAKQTEPAQIRTVTASAAARVARGTAGRLARKRESHGYFLMVLLTVSVTVCWTPYDLYFTLKTQVPGFQAPMYYYEVVELLFSLQTTMDPVVFALATQNLRNALRDMAVQRTF